MATNPSSVDEKYTFSTFKRNKKFTLLQNINTFKILLECWGVFECVKCGCGFFGGVLKGGKGVYVGFWGCVEGWKGCVCFV